MLATDSRTHGDVLESASVDGIRVYLFRTGATSYRIRLLVSGCMDGGRTRFRSEPSARRAFSAVVDELRRTS